MRYVLLFLIPLLLWTQKPDLLLLETYKDQNISGWVMSEKLDGVRAYWTGKALISRGGYVIHAPESFTKGFPPFELDGELWTKRGDFNHISSVVRDAVPSGEWSEVTYHIFEVPHVQGGLVERLQKVKPYESKILKIIPQIKIRSKRHLQVFLKSIESEGGEGVVVRDPTVAYIAKRTSKALKVKTFQDAECKVEEYVKGKGKYKDVMGALKCRLSNGIQIKIGSGFSDEERKNPPAIGTEITFKYKELTKNGKPRFPVFIRVREAF